jgi:hypothetical protein
VLDENEIEACEREAADMIGFLMNEPSAADDLVRTLVWKALRNTEKSRMSAVSHLDPVAFPAAELTTLSIRMPLELASGIDKTLDAFYPSLDQEKFICLAVGFALENLGEDEERGGLGLDG